MGICLEKGEGIDLRKGKGGVWKILVGVGWDGVGWGRGGFFGKGVEWVGREGGFFGWVCV